MEENASKLHLCTDFNLLYMYTRVTVYAECICVNRIFEMLSIRDHCAICRCLATCRLCLCPATFSKAY